MAIPPELEVRQYASKNNLVIKDLTRSDTRMVVRFEDDEGLDEMVKHFSKRSSIDVDKHLVSVVFIKREAPNVQAKEG